MITLTLWSAYILGLSLTAYETYFRVRGWADRPLFFSRHGEIVFRLVRLAVVYGTVAAIAIVKGFVLAGAILVLYLILSHLTFRACVKREMRYQYARFWYSMRSKGEPETPSGLDASDWTVMLAASAVLGNMGASDTHDDAARARIIRIAGDVQNSHTESSSDIRLKELREYWDTRTRDAPRGDLLE